MVYDYEDDSEIPDLSEFTEDLIEDVLCSALFQAKSEKSYNMLKLPPIMAPCLLGKQINSENLKKTIMEKQFMYEAKIIEAFQKLVESKELRINSIRHRGYQTATEIGGYRLCYTPSSSPSHY